MKKKQAQTQAPTQAQRGRLALEGLMAGCVLGLADLLATGPWRVPASFSFFVLLTAAASGLLSGLVLMPIGKRGLAAAFVLGCAVALQGASLVSKEWGGEAVLFLAVLVVALGSGALSFLVNKKEQNVRVTWLALAAVPAGSLLASSMGFGVLAMIAGLLLPLIVLLLLVGRKARTLVATAFLLGLLLPLPVLLLDPAPSKSFEQLSRSERPSALAPDVILVVIDTLRADAVDWNVGNTQTPTLAGLAREGVRFESAIASAPWTLPSVSSLFTGLLPSQHGAIDRRHALPKDAVTLAEQFHAAGYQTAAFTGGAFLDPSYGLAQGFEHFDAGSEYWFRPLRVHVPLAWRVVKNRFWPLRAVLRQIEEFGGFEATRDHLKRWLVDRQQEDSAPARPLLLLLHTYAVHDYYLYHPDPDDSVRERLGDPPQAIGERLTVNPEELFDLDQEALGWFEAIYHARVAQADEQLGLILDDLRAARPDRERLIVVTADHGEGFDADKGRVHHGGRLHDDLLRIPLVMASESNTAPEEGDKNGVLGKGRVVTEQVRQVDLAPTLLELAGVEPLPDAAGSSLLAPLAGDAAFPTEAWAEELMAGPRWLALRAPPWKLMESADGKQRFNLEDDPGETNPLEWEGVPALNRLWSTFDARFPPRSRTKATLDAAVQDQLNHIGYGD